MFGKFIIAQSVVNAFEPLGYWIMVGKLFVSTVDQVEDKVQESEDAQKKFKSYYYLIKLIAQQIRRY